MHSVKLMVYKVWNENAMFNICIIETTTKNGHYNINYNAKMKISNQYLQTVFTFYFALYVLSSFTF